jgi:ubiquinone biosynthesis monooxygenase Coq6
MCVNNLSLSYKQLGVVATVELNPEEAEGNTIAWQRFLPSGPVALLPLSENLSSLVWSTSVEHAKELLKMEPDDFVIALNEAYVKHYPSNRMVSDILKTFDNLLPNKNRITQLPPTVVKLQENSRAAFPLGFGHASSYVCTGAALIGDAAHRIHPLAGQGVNLGFGDVVKLTEVLSESVYGGNEIGNLSYLLQYERERLKANVPIMVGVHALQQLYCNEFPPAVLMRSLGTKITNSAGPLKNFLMQKAMS